MNKDRNDLSSSDYPWFGTSLEDSAVEDEDEQKPQPIKRARQYSLSTLATNSYGVTGLSTNYNPCDTEADDIQDVWTSGDDSDYNEEAWPSSTSEDDSHPQVHSKESQPEVLSQTGKDWNAEFQKILEQENTSAKYEALSTLANDFVYCAKTYGKIIISEVTLPVERKSIPPIDVGGIGGGAKYLCQGILFKFSADALVSGNDEPATWMYGGNEPDVEAAMKAAGHDLKGLMNCWNAAIPELHFPLMALIDYRGYRLGAISILPINKATIVYGSADGGYTIHAKSQQFNTIMQKLGTELKMKSHKCHPRDKAPPVELCGPADIEGHIGTDGKFYLIDFARCLPPESTVVAGNPNTRAIFYCLFRSEFMKLYRSPLSSDAFSGFDQSEKNRSEVRKATKYLHDVLIPTFAKKLDDLPQKELLSLSLTNEVHRDGINVRHMGRIRSLCSSTLAKQVLLTEMCARSISRIQKRLLRKINSEEGVPVLTPYRNFTVNFCNKLVGAKASILAETKSFWCSLEKDSLKFELLHQFLGSTDEKEIHDSCDLRDLIVIEKMFHRLCQLTGIVMSTRILLELQGKVRIRDISVIFLPSDIEDFTDRVKHLSIVDEAEANNILLEAINYTGPHSEQLWSLVNERMQIALSSAHHSVDLLFKWSQGLFIQAKSTNDRTKQQSLINLALRKLYQILEKHPGHLQSCYLLALVLLTKGASLEYGHPDSLESFALAHKYLYQVLEQDYDQFMPIIERQIQDFHQSYTSEYSKLSKPKQISAAICESELLLAVVLGSKIVVEREKIYYQIGCVYVSLITMLNSSSPNMVPVCATAGQFLEATLQSMRNPSLSDGVNIFTIQKWKNDCATVSVYTSKKGEFQKRSMKQTRPDSAKPFPVSSLGQDKDKAKFPETEEEYSCAAARIRRCGKQAWMQSFIIIII